jgi:hypothetical protein
MGSVAISTRKSRYIQLYTSLLKMPKICVSPESGIYMSLTSTPDVDCTFGDRILNAVFSKLPKPPTERTLVPGCLLSDPWGLSFSIVTQVSSRDWVLMSPDARIAYFENDN